VITVEIFKIENDWDIGRTRRYIVEESKKLGFNTTELGEISIVINELCTNFIKHKTVDGTLTFRILNECDRTAIEITAQDKGPGIKNIDEVIKDGVSSKGTMGGGLGAIKRLMDSFEIYSYCDNDSVAVKSTYSGLDSIGTLIILKKWINHNLKPGESDIKLSLLSRPYAGMAVNGDQCYVKKLKDRCLFAVIDGLGHGLEANKVSKLASEIIEDNTHKSIEDMLAAINNGLKYTRGAVAGIMIIDTIKKEFQYSAVGNVEFRYFWNGKTERLVPSNGLLGAYDNRKIKVHRRPYEQGALITMCTDGITNKWDFDTYLNVDLTNPAVLANLILRDFGKKNDDATVLVAILQ
jgi:anti-sigma regulatory factor (Ser/Thr protein kinase)/serine/threonine protein phosphatase PrpC